MPISFYYSYIFSWVFFSVKANYSNHLHATYAVDRDQVEKCWCIPVTPGKQEPEATRFCSSQSMRCCFDW